ncbi:MAG: hypothetical protein KAI67_04495 [Candidatus Pacebacteria bacterium]|nr:hypothetical protein [Candidatus Paceibacterota bacterium]
MLKFDERIITLIRPSLKKHISDKRRSSVLLLVSLLSIFIGIPLLCAIVLLVETFSTLASVVVLIVGIVVIAESFSIFGSMSMYSWIFEYNDEGELPNIYFSF